MSEQDDRKRVKVIDRRWLTADGETRDEAELPPPEVVRPTEPLAPGPAEPEPPGVGADQEAARSALPPQALLDTVDFLAQYAMAFLTGQVPGVPRDPTAARLYIDLLTVVQERTRASASLQEAKVLDDVLYQLRLQLVATTR